MNLSQSLTAIGPGLTASFLASGGEAPYSYAVSPGGAGGSVNSTTGLYQAPSTQPTTPQTQYDTIVATDSLGATASAQIMIGTALMLFADILQTQLGLDNNHIYFWDQKIMQPTDNGLYIAISNKLNRPFSNQNTFDGTTNSQIQVVNMMATLDLDIISRDTTALMRKEEVLMALFSNYSLQQQFANSFTIGRLPPEAQFLNLSQLDGAAIPYRYRISINIQYAQTKITTTPYFDNFETPEVVTNP